MPRLKYVGLKENGESAFIELTKIHWMPGSSHDVSDQHAEKMLNHPDVWALDEGDMPDEPVPDATGLAAATTRRGRPRKDAV